MQRNQYDKYDLDSPTQKSYDIGEHLKHQRLMSPDPLRQSWQQSPDYKPLHSSYADHRSKPLRHDTAKYDKDRDAAERYLKKKYSLNQPNINPLGDSYDHRYEQYRKQ